MANASPLRLFNSPWLDDRAVSRLSDAQVLALAPNLLPKWNKYIPHKPFAKQIAFLLLNCKEAMYGGQAGGGKSDALLMAALQYVDTRHYSAILFRRTFADLERPGALIPRSHEWLHGTDAHWNGRRWTFPSGAVLDFGYLDNANDVYRYQSSEYQFVGFDELTQFELEWYRYLFSRTRRLADSNVPIRVRGATNPGGIGHDWVKQRFLIEGLQNGRVFIPSSIDDNSYLDQDSYHEALSELDPITRAQLERGDWGIKATGPFFKRATIPLLQERPPETPMRMWDLAATKNQTSAWTAGALTHFKAGKLRIYDIKRIRGDPGEVEDYIRHVAEEDGRAVHVHMEQEPGSGGVNTMYRYRHTVLAGWTFEEYHPKHDKLTRASPLSALSKHGGMEFVVGPWNNTAFDEFESFPNGFKDQVDACSASLQVWTQRTTVRMTQL